MSCSFHTRWGARPGTAGGKIEMTGRMLPARRAPLSGSPPAAAAVPPAMRRWVTRSRKIRAALLERRRSSTSRLRQYSLPMQRLELRQATCAPYVSSAPVCTYVPVVLISSCTCRSRGSTGPATGFSAWNSRRNSSASARSMGARASQVGDGMSRYPGTPPTSYLHPRPDSSFLTLTGEVLYRRTFCAIGSRAASHWQLWANPGPLAYHEAQPVDSLHVKADALRGHL